jgi:hypothetical protein
MDSRRNSVCKGCPIDNAGVLPSESSSTP